MVFLKNEKTFKLFERVPKSLFFKVENCKIRLKKRNNNDILLTMVEENNRKKILHIVEAFAGGIFSILVDLVNSTCNEFDIVIAYSKRVQTPENFKSYFASNVKFIEVENFTRNISLKKDLKAFFEIRKIIKEEKPDIIHLHSSKAGFLGRFAANGNKIKILYNPHGFSFLMQDSSKLKRKIYWLIEKIGAFRKCTIVGCSQGEYEEALKLSKNAICINNGLNVDKLQNETKNFKTRDIDFDNLKICTSGRIGYQKNPKLFNKIAESFPEFKFTWIGDGDLKNKLTSKNITITGWKTRAEVLELVNENDIFILTSLWEGLPVSLLEAMYLGKVCIVTDCIGNRDVIKDGENGFIIDEENYKEIINSLNNNICQEVSKAAKQDILNKFNLEKMTEEYRREYYG